MSATNDMHEREIKQWQDKLKACEQSHADLEKKVGDLQRLCERAWIELDENWDKLVVDGLGPLSLITDLKKAKEGKEYKELRSFSNMVIKRFSSLEKSHADLEKTLDEAFKVIEYYAEPYLHGEHLVGHKARTFLKENKDEVSQMRNAI